MTEENQKDSIAHQRNQLLSDDETNNNQAPDEQNRDENITIQSRNVQGSAHDSKNTNQDESKNSAAPNKKANKNSTKPPPADLDGDQEGEEKEKNSEGKKIGGFIIGKTKGKGTFGKVK